jgi:hypothetical protein
MVENIKVLAPVGKSDHAVIAFDIKAKPQAKSPAQPMRNYYKGNYQAMRQDLQNIDWEEMFKD